MIFGQSIVRWVIVFFIALCVFFIAQWLIPLLFAAIGFVIPVRIANIIAILIAAGVVFGGYSYRAGGPA